jgi:chaperonin cofactor prefoldin
MDLVNTAINAGVVAIVGFLVAWYMKGRFDALERRIDRLEARIDRLGDRMDRFDGRMDQFQASLDAMRSDLTRVALAVGVQLGPEGAA